MPDERWLMVDWLLIGQGACHSMAFRAARKRATFPMRNLPSVSLMHACPYGQVGAEDHHHHQITKSWGGGCPNQWLEPVLGCVAVLRWLPQLDCFRLCQTGSAPRNISGYIEQAPAEDSVLQLRLIWPQHSAMYKICHPPRHHALLQHGPDKFVSSTSCHMRHASTAEDLHTNTLSYTSQRQGPTHDTITAYMQCLLTTMYTPTPPRMQQLHEKIKPGRRTTMTPQCHDLPVPLGNGSP
jgi:hypothetical protein